MGRSFVLGVVGSIALITAASAADMYRAPEPVGGGYKDGYVPAATWTG
ncbi:MAG: hypothetical protein WBX25_19955 [Rhodomicrobium sp.]